MTTISFLNMKGGVGKSTCSVNVSVGIADKGHRTLLVDIDPQSNSTSMFLDETPKENISGIIEGSVPGTKEAIVSVIDNLDLIPSSLLLANTEANLRAQTHLPQHNRLLKALSQVKDEYDYCIIDCPPTLNMLTLNIILASSLIIIPIRPDRFALQGFGVTRDNLNSVRDSWGRDMGINFDYKILFTMVSRNNEERIIIEQLRELTGPRAYKTEIRSQSKPVVAASSRSKPVIRETAQNAGVAEDLRQFVTELMEG